MAGAYQRDLGLAMSVTVGLSTGPPTCFLKNSSIGWLSNNAAALAPLRLADDVFFIAEYSVRIGAAAP
jgi:hypothetical protein